MYSQEDEVMPGERIGEKRGNDERFEELREQAKAEGKTVVEYLVKDEVNPTLSHFFNQAGAELSESDVEEIAEEIAAESEKKAEKNATEDDAADGEGDDTALEGGDDLGLAA